MILVLAPTKVLLILLFLEFELEKLDTMTLRIPVDATPVLTENTFRLLRFRKMLFFQGSLVYLYLRHYSSFVFLIFKNDL
jgi:hypothetical protein